MQQPADGTRRAREERGAAGGCHGRDGSWSEEIAGPRTEPYLSLTQHPRGVGRASEPTAA